MCWDDRGPGIDAIRAGGTVLTEIGEVEIEVPRDIDSSFEPQIVWLCQPWVAPPGRR